MSSITLLLKYLYVTALSEKGNYFAFSTNSLCFDYKNKQHPKNETSSQQKRFWQATASSDVSVDCGSWFLSFLHQSQHRRIKRQTCDTIYAIPSYPNATSEHISHKTVGWGKLFVDGKKKQKNTNSTKYKCDVL